MTNADFERAFGGQERVDWMRWQPSVVSGKTPCVSAHVRGGGEARRADAEWTVPMTWQEHQAMHDTGQESYAAQHGLDLDALAIETERRWQAWRSTHPPLPW